MTILWVIILTLLVIFTIGLLVNFWETFQLLIIGAGCMALVPYEKEIGNPLIIGGLGMCAALLATRAINLVADWRRKRRWRLEAARERMIAEQMVRDVWPD